MTISKGERWEVPADPSVVPTAVSSDAAAASAVLSAPDSGSILKLAAGDLLKTLGYKDSPEPAAGLQFSMDLGLASIDGAQPVGFVSHIVCRTRLWSGEFLVAMNAAWLGDLYLGPKSHPNDGLLDITLGKLGFRQRFLAAQRARLGTHLPHPGLTTKRVGEFHHKFVRPTPVYADGVVIGRGTQLTLSVVPDAFSVVV